MSASFEIVSCLHNTNLSFSLFMLPYGITGPVVVVYAWSANR